MSLKRDLRAICSRRNVRTLREQILELTKQGPITLNTLALTCVNRHLNAKEYGEDAREELTKAYVQAIELACDGLKSVKLRMVSPTEIARSLGTDSSLRYFVDSLLPKVRSGKISAETEEGRDEIKAGILTGLQQLLRIQSEEAGATATEQDRQLLQELAEDRLDGLIYYRLRKK